MVGSLEFTVGYDLYFSCRTEYSIVHSGLEEEFIGVSSFRSASFFAFV